MRDQALQEQERRQAQERAQRAQEQQQRPSAPAVRVPLHSIALDVPPQVLQVSTFININSIYRNILCCLYRVNADGK